MIEMARRLRRSVPNVVLGVIIGLLVGGGAYAVAQTTNGGVHGGPKPRFHDAGECNPSTSGSSRGIGRTAIT